MGNELATKYVRAHYVNSSIVAAVSIRWLHKLIYEFWGFCVNGGNSLTVPGGFAPVSGVLFPALWQSGTAVLLASGSDGSTQDGMPFFTAPSINWTSGTMVGKWLVTWKSGSTSTDDSVYPITQVISSQSIRVDVNNGATPYSGNLHPSFVARTGVNYRVVDFAAATSLAGFTNDSDGLVLRFGGAYLVNSGQITPQLRTRIRTVAGSNVPNVGLTLSSSGSWTPASSSGYFADPTSELSATTDGYGWSNISDFRAGTGYITLIGAQDFLICHLKGLTSWNQDGGSGFHVEVPQRLYPYNNDPNPFVMMNYGNAGVHTATSTQNYGGGFYAFHPPDGTTRRWRTMVRSVSGDYLHTAQYPSNDAAGASNGRYNEAFFNVYRNKFMMFEMACGLGGVSGQFAAMRFKLRRVRFVPPITPQYQRFGDSGEWFHAGNGILWPWDNAILPYNVFPAGV